jgi:ribosome-binding factor A
MAERRRVYKVAERMRSVVAMQLNRMSDPRFHLVTVTSVIVSSDLRNAKIYWSVSGGPTRKQEVTEALESAEGAIRREVGGELGLRFVPQLKFFYDDTMDVYEQTERLMDRIKAPEDRKLD